MRSTRWIAMLLVPASLALGGARATAGVHTELFVGCDLTGKLVVQFDASQPFPLPASRFPGIDGYAAAMPGISSRIASSRRASPGEDLLPVDPAARLELVMMDADQGMSVWNDRGTGVMRAGQSFALGSPDFDVHPIWNCQKGAAGERFKIRLRVRDAAGRHATSDVFEPEFAPDDETQAYVCPMGCGGNVVYPKPGECLLCNMRLKLLTTRSYGVSVTPEATSAEDGQIHAGVETPLRFRLETPAGGPVTDLEVVHEKLLHLLIVSRDLSWFAHEHPVLQADGSFTLPLAFPYGGTYTLFHDFTAASTGMQVVPVELNVVGNVRGSLPLIANASPEVVTDGYTVTFGLPSPVRALVNLKLTVRITRDGAPVTDLEPYLGALGHLIVVNQTRSEFVHSHPLPPRGSDGEATPAESGPEIVFSLLFPASGIYKAWAQFQHQGRVITAPLVFEVRAP